MKLVYVAGPFRGKSHWDIACNIRRAEALALEVWRSEMAALCPHANTAHFQDAAPDHVWLEGDLEMLRRCDAMILTSDWRRSSGATAEVKEALKLGIPVFEKLDNLITWSKGYWRGGQHGGGQHGDLLAILDTSVGTVPA